MGEIVSAIEAIEKAMEGVTPERLRELLSYDPATGHLTWKVDRIAGTGRRYNARAGDRITCRSGGYIITKIDGKSLRGHRIAWAIHYGEWPKGAIDHINFDKADNRIQNLRVCTDAENALNRPKQANNTSGFKGVSKCSNIDKWQAAIWKDGRRHHLGLFKTPEEASAAYEAAAKVMHGEFYHAR